jgi:hypothetical protein
MKGNASARKKGIASSSEMATTMVAAVRRMNLRNNIPGSTVHALTMAHGNDALFLRMQ